MPRPKKSAINVPVLLVDWAVKNNQLSAQHTPEDVKSLVSWAKRNLKGVSLTRVRKGVHQLDSEAAADAALALHLQEKAQLSSKQRESAQRLNAAKAAASDSYVMITFATQGDPKLFNTLPPGHPKYNGPVPTKNDLIAGLLNHPQGFVLVKAAAARAGHVVTFAGDEAKVPPAAKAWFNYFMDLLKARRQAASGFNDSEAEEIAPRDSAQAAAKQGAPAASKKRGRARPSETGKTVIAFS